MAEKTEKKEVPLDRYLCAIIRRYQVRLKIEFETINAPSLGWVISATPQNLGEENENKKPEWLISISSKDLVSGVRRLARTLQRRYEEQAEKITAAR